VALGGWPRAGAEVRIGWNERGLSALAFDGVELLADGGVAVTRVVTADRPRDRRQETQADWYAGETRTFADADAAVLERSFDRETSTVSLTYGWGRLSVRYAPRENGLDLRVEIANTAERTIECVAVRFMELRFAEAVVASHVYTIPAYGYSKVNLGGPSVVRTRSGAMQALWLSRQANRPMLQEFAKLEKADRLAVVATAGHPTGGEEVYDGVWDARPIRPGERDVWELSLRFAPGEVSPYALAADVFEGFAAAHPMTLNWPDRRPITMIHIADNRGTAKNPRGWGHAIPLPADWDLAAADSHATFREAALRGARNLAQTSRRMGAQGVIVWQIEGQEYHDITYYGDPQILPHVAPEMDAVADEFFATIREAGLRVGITVAPTYHFPTTGDKGRQSTPDAGWKDMTALGQSRSGGDREIPASVADLYSRESAWCMVSRLDDKIRYAKRRWGASLFYIDANLIWRPRDRSAEGQGWSGKHIAAGVFEELHKRHPDILLIPEHQSLQYHTCTAPYGETPRATIFAQETTGPDVRAAYPEAFGVLMLHRQPNEVRDHLDRYVEAIAAGDVQLPHGWFFDFDRLSSIYHPAAALAPLQVHVFPEAIQLGGLRLDGMEDFRRALAERLDRRAPFLQRRAFVCYGDDVPPQRVNAVLGAIAEAGGIIAWSQPSNPDWPAFWRPDNPLKALTPDARAFVIPGKREATIVVANASPTERTVTVEASPAGLGLGVSKAADLHVESLPGLAAPPPPPPPDKPGADMDAQPETGDAWAEAMVRGVELDNQVEPDSQADTVLDLTNHRLRNGTIEVKVKPFGLRVLRATSKWPD